ncbi:MAG: hypothetical protein H7X80_09900, partial [bacterium]|nr:hypothetical protein [Candidatus Kapabacteria bacterium]
MRSAIAFALLVAFSLAANSTAANAPEESSNARGAAFAKYPGTEEGAKAMLTKFLSAKANYRALTKPLRPTKADYRAVFNDEDFAKMAEATYTPAWDGGFLVVQPNPGQTRVRLTPATTDELKARTGNADRF